MFYVFFVTFLRELSQASIIFLNIKAKIYVFPIMFG